MIQVWVKIINSQGVTDEEFEYIKNLSADQYYNIGISHDGMELLHCLIPISSIQLIFDFMEDRGQEPEIVKATYQNGIRYGFEMIDGELIEIVTPLPENIALFDSFFPVGIPQHQFAGWTI